VPSADPVERKLIARQGGFARSAKYGGTEATRSAREAFMSSWNLRVDPELSLDPAERSRRARSALRAHMTELARRSAKKRRAEK
jgi:hypothetical protein